MEKCDIIALSKGSEQVARTKTLNIVLTYGETGYVANDLGLIKSPRFELYHIPTKKSIQKSDNPLDFYKFIEKIWERKDEEK